jgi:hypothetical protein
MEARDAVERFEHGHRASGGHRGEPSFTMRAALAVAILAGLLAIATFLANDAVKDAIQSETRAANAHSQRNAFETEREVALLDASLAQSLSASSDRGLAAASKDEEHALMGEERKFLAKEKSVQEKVSAAHAELNHANDEHLLYELAVVALQIGIVLASVSIIARRRFLLYGGTVAGVVGAVVLVIGLAH